MKPTRLRSSLLALAVIAFSSLDGRADPSPAVVPANIVAWYAADYVVGDIVGGHHGSLQNGATFGTGKVGRAFLFDGSDDYVSVADAADLNLPGDFTIEAWVYATAAGIAGERTIVSKRSADNANVSFVFFLRNGQLVFSSRSGNGAFAEVSAPGNVSADTWAHVAVTLSGGQLKIFRDGQLSADVAYAATRPVTTAPLTIGGTLAGGVLGGAIDELTIYDRALSLEEIAAIHAAGSDGKARDEAARDFSLASNPNGVWSYGWLPVGTISIPQNLSLFSNTSTADGLEHWYTPSEVTLNPSASPVVIMSGGTQHDWAPGELGMHPGFPNGEYSVLRWTAPAGGIYAVSGTFYGRDTRPTTTDVHIFHKATELTPADKRTVSSYRGDGVSSTHTVAIRVGDTVDFIVGNGIDGAAYDNTGLAANIVLLIPGRPLVAPVLAVSAMQPYATGKTWSFTATSDDTGLEGLTLKVQSSSTPTDDGSWSDVGTMSLEGNEWRLQTTQVPTGDVAFRAKASAPDSFDAFSAASALYHILPRPSELPNENVVTNLPTMTGKSWQFTAREPDTENIAGIALRLQYSATPGDPGSWVDLPGGALSRLATSSTLWRVTLSALPVGTFAFRVATTAPGREETFSDPTQLFNILAAAPVLELMAEVKAASDATGATTHRGDALTYTFKYRNSGALPATDLLLETFVPPGLKVATKSKGSKTRIDKTFGLPYYNYLGWKIATLAPSDTFSELSYTAKVLEPTDKTEATLNVTGGQLLSTTSLGNADQSVSAMHAFLQTLIVDPIEITAVQRNAAQPAKPGGLVEFDITLTNHASYTTKNALIKVTAPPGLVIQGPGVFLGADGQPSGIPLDPITNKQVKFAGLEFNPLYEEDPESRQVVYFGINRILPGGSQKVRVTFRIVYDWDIADAITFTHARGSWRSPAARGIIATNDPVPVALAAGDPGAAKPKLAMVLTQAAAGVLPGNPSIAAITQGGFAVPDALPKRRSNQIVYRLTYANFGNAVANFVRIAAPVPDGTSYVANSARVSGGADDPVTVAKPKLVNGFLIFNVPYLEANFPATAGSAKTLEFMVKLNPKPIPAIGTRITMPGGLVGSREVIALGGALEERIAEVVAPANMSYIADGLPIEMTASTTEVRHRYLYNNQGGINATGVTIRYTIPAGLKFKAANFCDALHREVPAKGRTIPIQPAVDATSGNVEFKIGKVAAGASGFGQVILAPDPTNVPTSANTTPENAYRADGNWSHADDSTAAAAAGVRRLAVVSAAASSATSATRLADSNAFLSIGGPPAVHTGGEFSYQLIWGNTSGTATGDGIVNFPIPEGTEYVSATATDNFGNASNDAAIYRAPGVTPLFPNGGVQWAPTALAPHSVKVASVRVKVKPGFFGKVECTDVTGYFNNVGTRYALPFATKVLFTDEAFEDQQLAIYASATGNGASASVGTAALPGTRFVEAAKLITSTSRIVTVAGADFAHVAGNGAIVIPLGGGNMVAAGGLNLVAAGGGNLITDNGAGMVAAGAGNAVSVNVPGQGFLAGSQFIPSIPSMVAAGGLNLVAAGAGNLIRKPANLIGLDGGSLIGLDGGSLIGLDGGSLGTFSIKNGLASFAAFAGGNLGLAANAASMVAAGAGNLVAAGGGNMVAAGGMNALPAGTLIGNSGNTLIGNNGNTLVGNSGNTLVGNSGNTFSAGNAASQMVAAGAGNFVRGGTGMVAAGAGN